MLARTDRPGASRELAVARRRALALHKAGKLDAAVAAYQAVLKRHPRACDCWCNLGAALRALGRKTEGLATLRQGLRACPHHVGLHRNLGNALEDAGDKESARELHGLAVTRYEAALKGRPDDAELYRALGWSLWKLERLEAAAAAYQRAIAIDSSSTAFRLELGEVLTALGRYADNEQQLRAAPPHNAAVLAALGHALVDQGRLEAGMACGNAALAIDPDHGQRALGARPRQLPGRTLCCGMAGPCLPPQRAVAAPVARCEGTRLAGRGSWPGSRYCSTASTGWAMRSSSRATRRSSRAAAPASSSRCPPELVALLKRLPDVAEVVPRNRQWPRTDWVCSLMDVPGIWGTDRDSIPGACPYLPSRAATGPPRLGPKRRFRVGIVWAGIRTTGWTVNAPAASRTSRHSSSCPARSSSAFKWGRVPGTCASRAGERCSASCRPR